MQMSDRIYIKSLNQCRYLKLLHVELGKIIVSELSLEADYLWMWHVNFK